MKFSISLARTKTIKIILIFSFYLFIGFHSASDDNCVDSGVEKNCTVGCENGHRMLILNL